MAIKKLFLLLVLNSLLSVAYSQIGYEKICFVNIAVGDFNNGDAFMKIDALGYDNFMQQMSADTNIYIIPKRLFDTKVHTQIKTDLIKHISEVGKRIPKFNDKCLLIIQIESHGNNFNNLGFLNLGKNDTLHIMSLIQLIKRNYLIKYDCMLILNSCMTKFQIPKSLSLALAKISVSPLRKDKDSSIGNVFKTKSIAALMKSTKIDRYQKEQLIKIVEENNFNNDFICDGNSRRYKLSPSRIDSLQHKSLVRIHKRKYRIMPNNDSSMKRYTLKNSCMKDTFLFFKFEKWPKEANRFIIVGYDDFFTANYDVGEPSYYYRFLESIFGTVNSHYSTDCNKPTKESTWNGICETYKCYLNSMADKDHRRDTFSGEGVEFKVLFGPKYSLQEIEDYFMNSRLFVFPK